MKKTEKLYKLLGMKPFLHIFLILCSIFFISCDKDYSVTKDPNSIYVPPREDPYKPEINLPKEIKISGKYTLTKENKNFQLNSEDQDWYCYTRRTPFTSESIVPLRFRLYNKKGKLVSEGLLIGGEGLVSEFNKDVVSFPNMKTEVTIFSLIPYHKDGVKIKAILVDDEGKDLKVLAERGILPPEEFRERFFYKGCYRQVGFGIE